MLLETLMQRLSDSGTSLLFALLIPFIAAICVVAFWWVSGSFLSFLIKSYTKKSPTCVEGHEQKSIVSRFIFRYQEFLTRIIGLTKWVLTLYSAFVCIAQILNILHYHIKVKNLVIFNVFEASKSTNVDLNFLRLIHFFNKSSETIVSIYFTFIVTVCVAKFGQYAAHSLINRAFSNNQLSENRVGRNKARQETMTFISRHLVNVSVTAVLVLSILKSIGVNIPALLTTAGLASVAIGFGAQALVRDIIHGFLILFEDQFAVGDRVEINGFEGTIEHMTLRLVRMRGDEGSIVIIPAGDVRIVKNFSTNWSRIDFKLLLAPQVDGERVTEILRSEVKKLVAFFPSHILDEPEFRPLEKITDHDGKTCAVLYRIFIKTTNESWKFKIESHLNSNVLKSLKEVGIYAPNPL